MKQEYRTELVMIRHGETASNKEHRYLGRTEEPLSEAGTEKLLYNKKLGRYPKIDILFSSPMQRCLETAEILYPDKAAIVVPEWREMDFGEFEGKNYLELKDDARYQAWIDSNGTLPFPGGESREQFVLRTSGGLEQVMAQIQERKRMTGEIPHTAAAVVHGGSIMTLLSRFAGGEYFDYQVKNGEGYWCELLFEAEEEGAQAETEKSQPEAVKMLQLTAIRRL